MFDSKLHGRLQKTNLALIRQHYENHRRPQDDGVMFDVGANRGIYTYYGATLGWEVHSFEIQEEIFKQLSHAALYNPKAVADRVHLYPIGISRNISRSGHDDKDEMAYLGKTSDAAEKQLQMTSKLASSTEDVDSSEVAMFRDAGLGDGPTLAIPMDCLLWHVPVNLDRVDLVKIDVEGYEIAAIQGAKQTFFRQDHSVGAFIVEVGPRRWDRAGTTLSEGIDELRSLSDLFEYSYVMLRDYMGCPTRLANKLVPRNDTSHKDFHVVGFEKMYRLRTADWQPVLEEMHRISTDCNFWFSKYPYESESGVPM